MAQARLFWRRASPVKMLQQADGVRHGDAAIIVHVSGIRAESAWRRGGEEESQYRDSIRNIQRAAAIDVTALKPWRSIGTSKALQQEVIGESRAAPGPGSHRQARPLRIHR